MDKLNFFFFCRGSELDDDDELELLDVDVLDEEDDDRGFWLSFFLTENLTDLANTFGDLLEVETLDFDFATPKDDDEEESDEDFAMVKFRLTDSFLSYKI